MFILLFIVLTGCASRPVGHSDFDASTDFSGYRTFSWMSEHPLFVASPDPVNPALEGIIIDTFDRASAQKKWMGRSESEITQRDRMNLRPVVRE